MIKLYIAGPMSGYPEYNRWAFGNAEVSLTQAGYDTVDPAPYENGEYDWADYLKRDLPLMLQCDGVATLPDWQESKGATLEVHVAQQVGLPVMPVARWIERVQ